MVDIHLKTSRFLTNPPACPECRTVLDGATGTRAGGPRPGTFGVCVTCGCYLQYTETLDLQAVSVEEFEALPERQFPPGTKLLLQLARETALRRGR